MTTALQQAATALLEQWGSPRMNGCLIDLRTALEAEQAANSRIASLYEELRKATDGGSESMTHDDALKQISYWQDKEQAQAVEPTTTKTEQVAGAISKHISTPLIQREVIAAAQYIAHRYMRTTPPAGEQVDWQDMYLKAKSEKEAMAAKYEKDIGPLARVGPATGERAEVIKELRLLKFHVGGSIGDIVNRAADMLEAGAKAQQVAVPAGYALVPIEITEEMHVAAVKTLMRCTGNADFPPRVFRAMLAAAQGAKP